MKADIITVDVPINVGVDRCGTPVFMVFDTEGKWCLFNILGERVWQGDPIYNKVANWEGEKVSV